MTYQPDTHLSQTIRLLPSVTQAWILGSGHSVLFPSRPCIRQQTAHISVCQSHRSRIPTPVLAMHL
jgi:hypothetical protein